MSSVCKSIGIDIHKDWRQKMKRNQLGQRIKESLSVVKKKKVETKNKRAKTTNGLFSFDYLRVAFSFG
jgi:hypothetical protein